MAGLFRLGDGASAGSMGLQGPAFGLAPRTGIARLENGMPAHASARNGCEVMVVVVVVTMIVAMVVAMVAVENEVVAVVVLVVAGMAK